MPEQILYTAIATSTGDGRNGHVRSTDGLIDTDVRFPVELGGAGGATNPEQLFAAGYAACFHSALKSSKQQHGVDVNDSAVTAEVGIGPTGLGGFGLAVTLRVEMSGVSPGGRRQGRRVAHDWCPYSNATRGNVDVVLEVEVA